MENKKKTAKPLQIRLDVRTAGGEDPQTYIHCEIIETIDEETKRMLFETKTNIAGGMERLVDLTSQLFHQVINPSRPPESYSAQFDESLGWVSIEPVDLEPGEYEGVASGHIVSVTHSGNYPYRFLTHAGVKGVGIPVKITVETGGKATVTSISTE